MVLSKKQICNFYAKMKKLHSDAPVTQTKMTRWSTASFASRQNRLLEIILTTFCFLIIIFSDFCMLNWKCPLFSFQKFGHLTLFLSCSLVLGVLFV